MEYLNFKELSDLENAAQAGDKEAQERLNSMAREEGYQDYPSMNESFLAESLSALEYGRRLVEAEKKRREATPNFMYCMSYLKKLGKSQNPFDIALYESMPYRQIYAMAKAVDKELMRLAQADPAPTVDTSTSDVIRQAAINSTSVIAGSEYDSLTNAELKHKAARFDAMRNGKVGPKATNEAAESPKDKPGTAQVNEPPKVVSEKIEKLNKLSVMWVKYNQTDRISKEDDMKWFLEEYAPQVGLPLVTVAQFKKHLPKARDAQVIDFDSKSRRYIPKNQQLKKNS